MSRCVVFHAAVLFSTCSVFVMRREAGWSVSLSRLVRGVLYMCLDLLLSPKMAHVETVFLTAESVCVCVCLQSRVTGEVGGFTCGTYRCCE